MPSLADVKNIYDQLQSYEESVLGFLADPGTAPDFATDLLANLTTNGLEEALLYQIPHNPSFLSSGMQTLTDKVNATNRDLGIRQMSRLEYYEDAAVERQEETLRNNARKKKLIQQLMGNSEQQR